MVFLKGCRVLRLFYSCINISKEGIPMFNFKNNTDLINRIFLISLLLLAIEITIFNQGIIFAILLSSIAIYFGRKNRHKMFGKILFWFGTISLFMTIASMMMIKFLLIIALIFVIIQFAQSKQNPTLVKPELIEPTETESEVVKRQPFFRNLLFGEQKTPEQVYEWNDINIQTGIGDSIVDLSYTVLPKGEVVILIRKFIGNIQVLVPYDLDISLSHSVIHGSTIIFSHHEEQTFNQTLNYTTENYERAEQKVKIITSILLGDIEVKRV